MTKTIESANELIAFLDANIVLEGRPATDLPWEQVTKDGLIRVLIVPKAMEEIDAQKRNGRLGPHARAFNRLISPSVISGEPVILREAGPRVELQMATCSRIPWSDYDELDPDDGDSRIVAEALNVRNVTSANRVLISHDIKPLAYARGRGLAVHQVSDEWLRGPEPHPKDKEIQRLKQEVAEFKKDEPTFKISIEVSNAKPPIIYRVAKLDVDQSDALLMTIKRQNPKKQNGRNDHYSIRFGSGFGNEIDSSYDEKYSTYIDNMLPAFVSKFSEKLDLLFNQRLLRIRVTNAGQIRADNLVISIRTNQGWINKRVVAVSPAGPIAPKPSPYNMLNPLIHNNLMHGLRRGRVGRHEFETTVGAKKSQYMETSCEDFRSGQEYNFEGVVAPTSKEEPLEITVTLTAKNLRGENVEIFRMEKEIFEIEPSQLVDLSTLELKQDFPTKDEIARLVEIEEYDEIEWDNNPDD
jgi:hypothetical protein